MIHFSCTRQNFLPVSSDNVRWLDQVATFPLAQAYWNEMGQSLTQKTWDMAHQFGYSYAAIVEELRGVSIAAVWRYSPDCWEVAAVSTLPGLRRRGYSKRVVAFVTSYILESGRLATCCTDDDNMAMIATARSVGFQVISEQLVWWDFPNLPDF
jgi:predicted GNAT family acetyltransferase